MPAHSPQQPPIAPRMTGRPNAARSGASIAALLLLAALTSACGDDPVGDGATGRGELTGMVARAKTGEGVANAVVALVRDGAVVRTTATDGAGGFAFDAVPAGGYDVYLTGLELTGMSLLHTTFEPRSQRVEVAGEVEPLLFAAVGVVPARITGIVRCGGAVDTDAAVRVAGGAVDTVVATNAVGRYALTDLDGGAYALFPVRARCLDALPDTVVHAGVGQYVGVDFDG